MSPLPNFPSLTPDERVWRLDWFGECAYPGSVRRYAQPSIKVAISPLRCEPNDAEALLQPGGTDHMHQREVWAPVAVLPLLAIGDLWQGGRLIASPSYHAETFRSVQIVPGTTSFVKAGLAVDEKFLIPLHAHPWHRPHTQAYCVAVSLGGDRRLLIPCVEIIRFYFGSSSNLLQRLFSMPLNAEALWSSKSFDPGSRHMHLVLAPGISGASASDVGRMAGDRLAWRSAAGIHISCQKAAASGQVAYPYTGFPFEGETNLAVTGVWLPFGDEPRATFLAYQLRSCSHAFPFRSLSYETSRRNAQGARSPESSRNATGVRHVSEISLRTKTVDDDPSARKSQHSKGFTTNRGRLRKRKIKHAKARDGADRVLFWAAELVRSFTCLPPRAGQVLDEACERTLSAVAKGGRGAVAQRDRGAAAEVFVGVRDQLGAAHANLPPWAFSKQ
jgi:hypothetical protein